MPLVERHGLKYLTFDLLERHGVVHGVFTRRGGVSPEPWASLNMGSTVGDDWGRVQFNIRKAFDALGLSVSSRFDAWLVHGKTAVVARQPRPVAASTPPPKADIILTANPGVTLVMRFADCVPILLYDPAAQVIAIAHAGWRGTVLGTAAAAVSALHEAFGSSPENILAAIGPSIGPDHYEIGAEVVEQVQAAFGSDAERLLPRYGERRHLDLWEANRIQLLRAGVTASHIETAGVCTACHVEDWYSHRTEHGRTGRFGALLALPR